MTGIKMHIRDALDARGGGRHVVASAAFWWHRFSVPNFAVDVRPRIGWFARIRSAVRKALIAELVFNPRFGCVIRLWGGKHLAGQGARPARPWLRA
jgi:hypothetical protein